MLAERQNTDEVPLFFTLVVTGHGLVLQRAFAPLLRLRRSRLMRLPRREHEGVPLKAAEIVRLGKFAMTNSMLVTWIVAVGIILFAQAATRNIKAVPDGKQNFWEWLVESLHNFLESIIGRDLVRKTFWFFATISSYSVR